MCPSPANKPDVASKPIQPAPGRYTSAQACKSVKSSSGPEGPSNDFSSDFNCTKYPDTKRAPKPKCLNTCTNNQA